MIDFEIPNSMAFLAFTFVGDALSCDFNYSFDLKLPNALWRCAVNVPIIFFSASVAFLLKLDMNSEFNVLITFVEYFFYFDFFFCRGSYSFRRFSNVSFSLYECKICSHFSSSSLPKPTSFYCFNYASEPLANLVVLALLICLLRLNF